MSTNSTFSVGFLLFPVLWGCIETNLKALDPEDTGAGPEVVPPLHTERCELYGPSYSHEDPVMGWTDEMVCNVRSPAVWGDIGNRTLTRIVITGSESSPTPPSNVRLVAMLGDEDDAGYGYSSESNFPIGQRRCGQRDRQRLGGDTTFLGNLNECFGSCDWAYSFVELQDPTRAYTPNGCEVYSPQIDVCTHWMEASPTRSEPIYSTCEAGSGRFRLIPRRLLNKDDDSNYSMILTPIQISGTGALTGAAWITSIDLVEDQGQTLRILKPNYHFRFDAADMLVDKNMVSLLLLDENDFIPGKFSGGAPIVGEELPETTLTDFVADMSWTCGTVPVAGERHPSPGYMVSPADLDCTGDWKQEFTLRPIPFLSPKKLHVERYGHVEDREAIELTPAVGGGYAFDHRRGLLRFRGTLSSMSAQGATLALSEASISGINVCDTGTYTLPPEQ